MAKPIHLGKPRKDRCSDTIHSSSLFG